MSYTFETERALIKDYRDNIAALCPSLTAENLPLVIELASIPEEIRGYGHVKERHLRKTKEKEAKLLERLEAALHEGRYAA